MGFKKRFYQINIIMIMIIAMVIAKVVIIIIMAMIITKVVMIKIIIYQMGAEAAFCWPPQARRL